MAIRGVDIPIGQISSTQPAQTTQANVAPNAQTPVDRRVAMQSAAPHYETAVGAQGALAPAQASGARFPEAWAENIRQVALGLVKHVDGAKALNAAFSRGLADV